MSDEIPQWAKERACELANSMKPLSVLWIVEDIPAASTLTALARYIAAHEEPPVDPLLIEARKLAADIAMERGANRDVVDHYETAKATDPEISRVIRVLRRGIELGKSDA
jgi:hypothetical protein